MLPLYEGWSGKLSSGVMGRSSSGSMSGVLAWSRGEETSSGLSMFSSLVWIGC